MIEDIRNIRPDRRALLRFGISLSVVLIIWGSIVYFRRHGVYLVFFGLSPLVLISAFVFPALFKPLYFLLTGLLVVVSTLITYLIVGIIFYLVITPMGLAARLAGKDILDQRIDKQASSYWICRRNAPADKLQYERQF